MTCFVGESTVQYIYIYSFGSKVWLISRDGEIGRLGVKLIFIIISDLYHLKLEESLNSVL